MERKSSVSRNNEILVTFFEILRGEGSIVLERFSNKVIVKLFIVVLWTYGPNNFAWRGG